MGITRYLLLFILLFTVLPFVFGYPEPDHYWTFDKDDIYNLSIGNVINGSRNFTAGNFPITNLTGQVNEYAFFENNDHVFVNNDVFVDDTFTISFWMNATNSYYQTIFYVDSDATCSGSFLIYFRPELRACYTSNQHALAPGDPVDDGHWTNVVVVRNTTGIGIYKNGTLLDYDSGSGTTTLSSNLRISGVTYDYIKGGIDEVAIWKGQQLTEAEIVEVYQRGFNGDSLLGFELDVTLISPNDGKTTNSDPEIVTYNVTDADNSTVSCSLYINGLLNQTNGSVSNNSQSNFYVTFPTGGSDYYVKCTDNDETSQSGTRSITGDYSEPVINSETPNPDNSTVFTGYSMNIQGNVTDNNIYRVNRTIYYPNGTIYYSNYSGDLTTNTTVYSWDITFNTTEIPNGEYEFYIQSADSHTDTYLKPAKKITKDTEKRELVYELDHDTVTIRLDKGDSVVDYIGLDTEKLKDRYTFEYNFGKVQPAGSKNTFVVVSKEPIVYLPESGYASHFILADKYWVDFEEFDGTHKVTKVNDYTYSVEITSAKPFDNIKFQSLGGLNENEKEITFNINNCVPSWSCSGYGVCNTSDLQPCNETVDANACGLPYTGDYSEFVISCNYCSRNPSTIKITRDTCPAYSFENHTYRDNNFATCCNVTKLADDCMCSVNGSNIFTGTRALAWYDCDSQDVYGESYLDYINEEAWHLYYGCDYQPRFGSHDLSEMVFDLLGEGSKTFLPFISILVILAIISLTLGIYFRIKKGRWWS